MLVAYLPRQKLSSLTIDLCKTLFGLLIYSSYLYISLKTERPR